MEWYELVAAIAPSVAMIVGIVLSFWFSSEKSKKVAESGKDLLAKGMRLVAVWHKANADGKVTADEWQEVNALIAELGPAGAQFYEDILAIREEMRKQAKEKPPGEGG